MAAALIRTSSSSVENRIGCEGDPLGNLMGAARHCRLLQHSRHDRAHTPRMLLPLDCERQEEQPWNSEAATSMEDQS
jgi:hypothetical protein